MICHGGLAAQVIHPDTFDIGGAVDRAEAFRPAMCRMDSHGFEGQREGYQEVGTRFGMRAAAGGGRMVNAAGGKPARLSGHAGHGEG